MKICCIDFETANAARGSACSVGLAVIEEGKITGHCERLIKPHASCREFLPFNISIHGIHPRDVEDAPEFGDLARWLFEQLNADLVVAHNAAFDMSVLRAVCSLYGLRFPEFDYFCTCKAAQRVWPEMTNHRLDTLCEHFGHRFEHHNAEADAEAAGLLLLEMLKPFSTPAELAAAAGLRFGHLYADGYVSCSSCARKRR